MGASFAELDVPETGRVGATMAGAAPTAATAPATSGVAHSPQNLEVAAFVAPHVGQTAANRVAHSPQNLRPASFSVPQLEQITQRLLSVLDVVEMRGYRTGTAICVTTIGSGRLSGMQGIRIRVWLSMVLLAGAIVACSAAGATVGPRDASGPSPSILPSVEPSAEPTAAAPSATAAASPVEAPAALEVTCDGTDTVISTPLVRTQPDGIHIRFVNTSGRELTFGIEDAFGGEAILVGGGTFVYTFGPGTYRLTCAEAMRDFAIVDPDRLYTSAACAEDGGTIGTNEYGTGARGPRGTLLDVARAQLRGLMPGDVVERAGYPEASGAKLVRVVRQGQVVAVLWYIDDGHGGWLIDHTWSCPGSDVAF